MQYPVIAQPQSAFTPTFARGGMAEAARTVQSHGRNGDTVLVHMTPNEVNSLQGLAMAHGGSLTINPHTGLPEANFLKSILPIVAGLALGPAGLGLSAGMAGLTVGGATGLITGDLSKGLMAGLGAFGGAGLGGALASTGAGASATTGALDAGVGGSGVLGGGSAAAPAVSPTGAGMSKLDTLGAGLKDLTTPGGMQHFGSAFNAQTGGGLGTTAALTGLGAPLMEAAQPQYALPETTTESNYTGPYRPTERKVQYPGQARDRRDSSEFSYFTSTNPYPGFMAAASGGAVRYQEGGMVDGAELVDSAVQMPPQGYQTGTAPEFNYNFRPVGVDIPSSATSALAQTALNPAATLGPVEETEDTAQLRLLGKRFDRLRNLNKPIDVPEYRYDPAIQRTVPTVTQMAQGGLAGLNAFNKGGMPKGRFLQGAGDGVSDSIPATIGGTQPARLADGEFVIDARTVSEIGNGSSKAGAKKLYAMMERVHQERKKAKRGQDSNADKHLPA